MEFEESSTKYEDLLKSLEGEKQHRDGLTNLLEDGDAYYQAALKEATIIANVSPRILIFRFLKLFVELYVDMKSRLYIS